jgi:hypothetical protein
MANFSFPSPLKNQVKPGVQMFLQHNIQLDISCQKGIILSKFLYSIFLIAPFPLPFLAIFCHFVGKMSLWLGWGGGGGIMAFFSAS